MALKGNLKDFSLTQLLNLIRLARKTGGLTIQDSGSPLHIFCEEGKLIHVSQNGKKGSLSEMMIKTGRLTEQQLRAVRPQLALNTDKELALRLMDLGFASREDIVQALRQQMLESLYPVFSWSKGNFVFDPEAHPAEDEITVFIDMETIIMEGGRRVKETGKLQETIPTLDVTPRLTPQQDARMRSIHLSVDQWKVISFINGRNTLKQVGNYVGMSEFQVRKVFQELITAGLVELAQAQEARREATAPRATAAPRAAAPSPAMSRSIVLRLIDRIRRI